MRARRATGLLSLAAAAAALAGCSEPPVEPAEPAWADVAPIFRGECNSCHGWTAKQTGGSYRFDFFQMSAETCGDAALALDSGVILAGNALAAGQIAADVQKQGSSSWARMPPPPSPALPDWERSTVERWAANPIQGTEPKGNRPPTLDLSSYSAKADRTFSFTTVLEDPDGDAALGVIEVNGLAFLMNRTGSFTVSFDSSSWPNGSQDVKMVVCDGWAKGEYHDSVQIAHPAPAAGR
jgi:hypothetical protein